MKSSYGLHNSHMTHTFAQAPQARIERSVFNRTHCFKTTFDVGYIVPFMVDEVLPGDTFNVNATLFGRLSTPITPFMDNLYMDTFFFFVPLRLVWDNFQKFMGEQVNPGDSTSFVIPTITCPGGGWAVGTLSDYFGLPTGIASVAGVSSLWHRGYNRIFSEWFRDENLQNTVTWPTGNGPDADTLFTLLRRGKRHDYFTSALPWPQKGPGVSIPLGNAAPITGIGKGNQIFSTGPVSVYEPGGASTYSYYGNMSQNDANNVIYVRGSAATGGLPLIYADLSSASAATINSLRQAFQLQKLYERDARGGTRYIEIIKSHFGVTSPDSRLQRTEYLGGSVHPVGVHPVPQTSVTAATPQGNLAAFGTVQAQTGFSKSFVEHGLLYGLMSVRADLTYQQGLPRMFSRSSRFDFYWPALAHLGEQSVLNKEIYCQGGTGTGPTEDGGVFGYQERYAEYRYKPSQITGKLRSTYATTLDIWHLAQKFTALPTLSDSFIQDTPPIARVIAVNTEPHFILDSYIQMRCARPMPVYSVPGLIDHF